MIMKYEKQEKMNHPIFSQEELRNLQKLRKMYQQEKHRKFQMEQRHLEFIRWLVRTGRLTD
jgi:hypothetical protein